MAVQFRSRLQLIIKQFNKEVLMTKKNGVNHSLLIAAKARRKSVIERLEHQLKVNLKTRGPIETTVSLTEHDVKRIKKEIETLKTRV